MEKVAVIGGGAWGTTLANLVSSNGYGVSLWVMEKDVVSGINKSHENSRYLPGIKLSEKINCSSDLKTVLDDAKVIVLAVPSQFLRNVLKEMSQYVGNNNPIFVDVAKGIEHATFKTMSGIINEEITVDKRVVVLSGPNHAEEVSRKLPTATVVASSNQECLPLIVKIFSTEYFKVFPHDDLIGVEICGSMKNVAAIATGISSGLGHGDNATASIMTLALAEMVRVGKYFGAKRSTFYGLAGVGDLIATCTSKHSRNRYVGTLIGQGKRYTEIRDIMDGRVAEGVPTCKSVYDLGKAQNIDLPLTNEIYQIIYENKELKKAISDLIFNAK